MDTPVLSYTAGDPAASGTINASPINFAYIGSSGTAVATPTYCGEVDVVGENPPTGMNAGAWVEAGITQPIFISVGAGTACNGNITRGQDIVNAVVGEGSGAITTGTDAAGNTVQACLSTNAYCQANAGPNGSVTP